ncbi:MAG: DMT family transporter [Geminicoccaceae bacterium]
MPAHDVLLAILVQLLWGVGFAMAKPAVAHFPPLVMMSIAYLVTTVALLPSTWRRITTPWPWLALIAALAATLQGWLIFTGLKDLPASTATLLIQLQVPFAVLCAWLLGGARPDGRRLLGIAVALLGVIMVAGAPAAAAGLPALLVALGALSWAAGQGVMQSMARDGGRVLTAGIAVNALPQLVLASALLEHGQLEAMRTASAAQWGAVLTFSVGGFAVAYTIWYGLLRRHPMDRVAPFMLLMPVIGVAFSAAAYGERPSPQELAGGAVVLVGLALVILRGGRALFRRAVSRPLP